MQIGVQTLKLDLAAFSTPGPDRALQRASCQTLEKEPGSPHRLQILRSQTIASRCHYLVRLVGGKHDIVGVYTECSERDVL